MARYLLGRRKLVKSGYSLRITIPNAVVEELDLEGGDEAEITYDRARKSIIIRFVGKKKEESK